jgi:hypothetical protein
MAGVSVLDQEHSLEAAMTSPKPSQLFDIMFGVLLLQDGRLHPTAMENQEQEQVDGSMPGILELLLLDGAGNGLPDWLAFQDLMVGDFVNRDGPDAHVGQMDRLGIAPQHLFRSLFEQWIESGGSPISRAVRLQVHVLQDSPDHAGADGIDNAVNDGLTGQIGAGPMGHVQPLGDGFQAGQLDDPRSL